MGNGVCIPVANIRGENADTEAIQGACLSPWWPQIPFGVYFKLDRAQHIATIPSYPVIPAPRYCSSVMQAGQYPCLSQPYHRIPSYRLLGTAALYCEQINLLYAFGISSAYCDADRHKGSFARRVSLLVVDTAGTFPRLERRLNQVLSRLIRPLESRRATSGLSLDSSGISWLVETVWFNRLEMRLIQYEAQAGNCLIFRCPYSCHTLCIPKPLPQPTSLSTSPPSPSLMP